MVIVKTSRLTIRHLNHGDAAFINELVNQPAWLEHIGDKGVHNLNDARDYITNGPLAMYRDHGFGLFIVENTTTNQPVGICGLIKRDTLPLPDIGFALLPDHCSKGYAFEAANAVIQIACKELKIKKILAVATFNNHSSIRLLAKLGFEFQEKMHDNGKGLNVYCYQCNSAHNTSH